jgi:hypothetical protein
VKIKRGFPVVILGEHPSAETQKSRRAIGRQRLVSFFPFAGNPQRTTGRLGDHRHSLFFGFGQILSSSEGRELSEKEHLAVEFTLKQWLRLKRRAQREKHKSPEELTAILEEIDVLLADLERKIATEVGSSLRGPMRNQDRTEETGAND